MNADLYRQTHCELAEGPVWYDSKLWWIDIEAGFLHCSDGSSYPFPFSVGAAVPCLSGRWLFAEEHGFSLCELGEESVRIWSRPQKSPEYRFNDGKVTPEGCFVAGSLKRGTLEGDCSFFQLDTDGDVRNVIDRIGLCNGLDWDLSRHLFYYVDTGASSVHVCLGRCTTDVRVFKTIDQGLPDGMCLDSNGNVWIAIWGEGCVLCLESETGRLLKRVEVPVPNVTSCCFGGENMDELFITTAAIGLDEDQLGTYPLSGSIFSCNPGVKGNSTRLFNDTNIK